MNDDHINEFDIELSPEEEASIDRIMAEAAALDNAEVDFDAIYMGVKRRAAEEGIVIFPSKRDRRANTRRGILRAALAGAAVAAAVLAVGFGALTLVKQVFPESKGNNVIADATVSEDASASLKTAKAPSPTSAVVDTEPGEEGTHMFSAVPATQEPDLTEDPFLTPLPTETAMKGGVMGYVLLDSFDFVPDEIREIVPDDLPAFMVTKGIEDPVLEAKSYGVVEDTEYYYECRKLSVFDIEQGETDIELGVGVARYSYDETALTLHYLWRISEDSFLRIDFLGFDRYSAEDLLLGMANAGEAEAA